MSTLLDLSDQIAEELSPAFGRDIPKTVGNEHVSGNGQPTDNKLVSHVSQISHQKQETYRNNPNSDFDLSNSISISNDDAIKKMEKGSRVIGSCLEVGNVGKVGKPKQDNGLSFPTLNLRNGKLGNEGALCEQPSPPPIPATDPAGWREATALFSSIRPPCPGFRKGEWAGVHAVILNFLEQHAETAHGLGWTTLDLFGVHATVGATRVDCCGALMVSTGRLVRRVEADSISFVRNTFRRRTTNSEMTPIWDFNLTSDR